jgi:transposase
MWLDRIQRSHKQFSVIGISTSGEENAIEIMEAYKFKLNSTDGCYLTLKTNFSSWERVSSKQYVDGYSISKGVTEHHVVYSFKDDSTTVLLPSWALQCDLFSPPSIIFHYLYSLNGFEFLCYPELDKRKFSVQLPPTMGRHLILRGSKCAMDRMTWLYAFPSAYWTWKSVYIFACEGKIGIDLPQADVTCTVHGKRVGDVIFADRIRISILRPAEAPIEWAQCEQKEFRFDARSTREEKNRRATDFDLSRKDGSSSLSDAEWGMVEPILTRFSPRTPKEQRSIMDAILNKLTSGKPWSAIDHPRSGVSIFASYYNMMKDGRWPKIRNVLFQSRNKFKKSRSDNDHIGAPITGFGKGVPRFKARRDTELSPRRGRWGTSNVEWKTIKVIVTGSTGGPQILNQRPRLVVDRIIEKLGTGMTWSAIASRSGISKTTLLSIYQLLNSDGRWAKIRSVLCNVRAKTRGVNFPSRIEGWRLSEAEWKTIQPIVTRCDDDWRSCLSRRPRFFVDCIIEKLGTGKSWADIARSNGVEIKSLPRVHALLKSDGRWQDICSALCNARGLVDRIDTKGD